MTSVAVWLDTVYHQTKTVWFIFREKTPNKYNDYNAHKQKYLKQYQIRLFGKHYVIFLKIN